MNTSSEETVRERREAIVAEHIGAENRQDVEATIGTFHHARYEVNGETSDGEEAVRELLRDLMVGFPDFQFEPGASHHADDAVIGEGRLTGTHQGTFNGVPATGRPIDVPVAGVFEFEDDRLVCEKVYFDSATLLRQIGMLPDADTAPAGLSGDE